MKLHYQINRYTISSPRLSASPAGTGRLRLAVLSDLHNNMAPGLLEALEREQPDAVLLAGDMVTAGKKRLGFGRAYGSICGLAARFPVYYTLGNHESRWRRREQEAGEAGPWAAFSGGLGRKGVHFLVNDRVLLEKEGISLLLVGLDLPKACYTHKKKKLVPPTAEEIRILTGEPDPEHFTLLSPHTPRFFEAYRAWGADLTVAGHYHGGVVRLPGLGGIIAPGGRLLPPFTKGLYRKGKSRLLVTAGAGTHTVPFRVFNPREIVILDFMAEKGEDRGPVRKAGCI